MAAEATDSVGAAGAMAGAIDRQNSARIVIIYVGAQIL
jgi:hypothetical protein